MKTFVFAVLILVGMWGFGQNTSKEVLIVEETYAVSGPLKGHFLFIMRPNEEFEEVELQGSISKEGIIKTFKLRLSTFARLYKEGWHLIATGGEGSNHRYIFEREKP